VTRQQKEEEDAQAIDQKKKNPSDFLSPPLRRKTIDRLFLVLRPPRFCCSCLESLAVALLIDVQGRRE